MRYRLVMVCALVGWFFQASTATCEPFENASGIRVLMARGAVPIGGEKFTGGATRDASSWRQAGFVLSAGLPAFQHISRSDAGSVMERAAQWGQLVWQRMAVQFRVWLNLGMTHAPVLVMGLALLLLVPPLTIAGWVVRRMQPDTGLTQNGSLLSQIGSGSDVPSMIVRATGRDAALELVGSRAEGALVQYPLSRSVPVVRIGREDDNEIQIRDKTVHRYHAAVDRPAEGGIAITDLSGRDGNGVTVNGERVVRAHLKDGDRIDLGAVSLSFRLDRE